MDYYTFVYDSGNVSNGNVQSNPTINLRKDIRTLDFIPLINYDQTENESNKENYIVHNDGLGMSIRSNMTTVKSNILSKLKTSNIDNLISEIEDDDKFVDFIKFEFLKYYTNNTAENEILKIKSLYDSGYTLDIQKIFENDIKKVITGKANDIIKRFLQFDIVNALEIERFINIQNYIKNKIMKGKKIATNESYKTRYLNIKYLFEPTSEEENKRKDLISGIRNHIKQNEIPNLKKTISILNNDENLYSILLKYFIIKKINNNNVTNYVISQKEREIANKYQIQSIVNNNNVDLNDHKDLIKGFDIEKKSEFSKSTNYRYRNVKSDSLNPINAFTIKNDILKFYLYNAIYNGYVNVLHHIISFTGKLKDKKLYQTNIIGDKDAGEKVTGYYNININNTSLNYCYQLYPIKSSILDNMLNMFFVQVKLRNYMLSRNYHNDMERIRNNFLEYTRINSRNNSRNYEYHINQDKEKQSINDLLYNKKKQVIQIIESYRANTIKMINQIKGKKPLKLYYIGLNISTIVPDNVSGVDMSPYDGKIITSFKEKDKICTDSENRFRKLLYYLSSASSNKILDPKYQDQQDKNNDKDKKVSSKSFRDKIQEDGQKISDFISNV